MDLNDIWENTILVNNTQIFEELKKAKEQGYRFLLVKTEIRHNISNTDDPVAQVILKTFKANELYELPNLGGSLQVFDLSENETY